MQSHTSSDPGASQRSLASSPQAAALEGFIARVAEFSCAHAFNPWREHDTLDRDCQAPLQRRENLRRHLDCPSPRLICLGECPGYKGARRSGIAFTSECLLFDGAIPRLQALGGQRLSRAERPIAEPSSTILWRVLYELQCAEQTLLWNAFPVHPHTPQRGNTNRTPSAAELRSAQPLLSAFVDLYPGVPIIAVGRHAALSLERLGITVLGAVRHPAHGGARAFRSQMRSLVQAYGL